MVMFLGKTRKNVKIITAMAYLTGGLCYL
jgi:hypothetical protein